MYKYSKRIIWIHWLSSVLIIALILSGIMMEEEPNIAKKLKLYQLHFRMGTAVFVLTLIRVYAFFKDPRPAMLYPEGNKRQKLIDFVHNGFYWVILWMCVSGTVSLFVENILPALKAGDATLLPDLTKDLSFIMLSPYCSQVCDVVISHAFGRYF